MSPNFTARAIAFAASFALVGSGLVAVAGASRWLPLVLAVAIVGCFVNLTAGARRQGLPVFTAVVLPLALVPILLVVQLVIAESPSSGWALMVAGMVPLFAAASLSVRPAEVRATR